MVKRTKESASASFTYDMMLQLRYFSLSQQENSNSQLTILRASEKRTFAFCCGASPRHDAYI